jgi:RNA polymerase sigma-70 factor (ECF subfamily)
MGKTTELEIELKRLEAGHLESRRTIIETTCERLRRMAHRMMRRFPGIGRWSDTDDVLQNALIRLHRSLFVVRPESARKYYGLAAVELRRELLDLTRSLFGPEGIGTNHDSDGGKLAKLVSEEQEPDTIIEWTEFHEQVERLPDSEREVFGLIFYDGLTQSQVGKVLGLSLTTVKRRWQTARMWLKDKNDGKWPD